MKKILTLITLMLVLACLLASCGDGQNGNQNGGQNGGGSSDNTETKVTYTVTVVDQDGNPVEGALIYFTPKTGAAFPLPTGVDGKVTYKTDKGMDSVSVFSVPDGYEYGKLNQNQSFDKNGNLTVTVTKTEEAPTDYFTIYVVDQNGNPVAGVRVQMCDSSSLCLPPQSTDAEGMVKYAFMDGEFHAQLSGTVDDLPEGYTVDNFGQYYNFTDKEVTIVLTKTN